MCQKEAGEMHQNKFFNNEKRNKLIFFLIYVLFIKTKFLKNLISVLSDRLVKSCFNFYQLLTQRFKIIGTSLCGGIIINTVKSNISYLTHKL